MDGGTWWAAAHGVSKSRTRLSNFTFTFHFHALEKEMATHSSVLAWRIPGTGYPGGLLSMGLHRVGHDWSDLAAAACGKQTKPDLVTVVTTSWEKRDSKYQRHQKYRRLNQSNQTGVPGFILFIPGKKNREETQWPWWKKLEIRWTHFFPFTDFYISQNIL